MYPEGHAADTEAQLRVVPLAPRILSWTDTGCVHAPFALC